MAHTDTVMYIFVNKGLGMSVGKVAAMAAHGATEAVLGSDPLLVKKWREGGHYCKLVMQAKDEEELSRIDKYITDRGFKTFRIIDEGMTEIDPMSFAALGVEVVSREDPHVEKTFSIFQLYRDSVRVVVEVDK